MANPKGPGLSLSMEMVPRIESGMRQQQRLTFENQHPMIEMIAFYERANKLSVGITDTRTGKTVETEYVIAPHRLMDYVKEGEPYGISFADMIFVSERTPHKYAPIVAFKLFEERFIDPGLDETGRVKHIRAALDAIRLASILDLTPKEVVEFIDVLVRTDPTGLIEADPFVQQYLHSWNIPERAAYLEAHHANWRVQHSKSFGAWLSGNPEGRRSFRDFRVSKADIIMNRVGHVNPYLLGHFIRRASTIPMGEPFSIDRELSMAAYALSKDVCDFALIEFVPTKKVKVGENIVFRSKKENSAEATWRSLVVRVETGLLQLEKGIDQKVEDLQSRISGITLEVERKRDEVRGELVSLREDPRPDRLAEVVELSTASKRLVERAHTVTGELEQELANLEELKRAIR